MSFVLHFWAMNPEPNLRLCVHQAVADARESTGPNLLIHCGRPLHPVGTGAARPSKQGSVLEEAHTYHWLNKLNPTELFMTVRCIGNVQDWKITFRSNLFDHHPASQQCLRWLPCSGPSPCCCIVSSWGSAKALFPWTRHDGSPSCHVVQLCATSKWKSNKE